MEVSVLRTTSFDDNDKFGIVSYSTELSQQPIFETPKEEDSDTIILNDPLEAIKLDPAVLEAQVTVNSGCEKFSECSSRTDEEDLSSAFKGLFLQQDHTRFSQRESTFEHMMGVTKAALFSLKPEQLDLLLQFVATLRQQRLGIQKRLECAFCKKNGESVSWYSSHILKDGRGRIRCPVLRSYRCPKCGATGANAHTIKYCHMYDE